MPEIISNSELVKDKYYKIIIRAPQIARAAKPGQFLMVKVSDNNEPLLRRPLGVHSVKAGQITMLYEVVGRGTKILSQRKSGEYLDIIGPLGNGFSMLDSRSSILVAGGMGVAPLVFLVERLAYSVERRAYRKNKRFKLSAKRYPLNAIVLIGAKTKGCVLCAKEFKEFNCEVKVSTDDGSRGFKGKVTDLLKDLLRVTSYELRVTIYACGPKPMLREISGISKKYNIPAQVSLEEHLACGFGACLGCAVNTKSGYQRVCKEGPVFDAQEIIWR